jgi:hypothetical protein
MLRIQAAQAELLRQGMLAQFESEMVAHLRDFAPKLFQLRGEACVREMVRQGVSRARDCGFTNRGPVRFYIELMFGFGAAFDTDPQYPWAHATRTDLELDQGYRAGRIYRSMQDYLEKVAGANGEHALAALRRLRAGGWEAILPPGPGIEQSLLQGLRSSYPKKFDYVGIEALRGLIAVAATAVQEMQVRTREGLALSVALMYGFGSGVFTDPLYPWVTGTLARDGASVEGRVERLYQKSCTYVDAVLEHWST